MIAEDGDREPIRKRLHEVSDSIEELESEIAVKQAELEELQKCQADPDRVKANLQSFGDLYERLGAVDRQQLMAMMVKQIRLTSTRMELELYDHPMIIEEWDDGPGGWFRQTLHWLPGPDSNQQPNG